jgi:type IV pilus assembly protein PilB
VETADIACRAALTGHLVLSTLHTQHALGTVARLLDMGLEPWMVASCLSAVLAQRLVQRVCEECAVEYTPPPGLLLALEAQFGRCEGARFRKGQGCDACMNSGNKGRIGVYELLLIDDGVRELLVRGHDLDRLWEYLTSRGYQTMEHDAFRKACQGLICPEEIIQLGFSVAMAMEEYAEEPEEEGTTSPAAVSLLAGGLPLVAAPPPLGP